MITELQNHSLDGKEPLEHLVHPTALLLKQGHPKQVVQDHVWSSF